MSEPTRETAQPAIAASRLVKIYENESCAAVDQVDFEIAAGESVAIMGPSGCGKSTLLNLIAAMDRPDSGELCVFGQSLAELDRRQADNFRRLTIGFVFQLHNLLPHLTAHENVQVPMLRGDITPGERCSRASMLLEQVGLAEKMSSLPPKLSGGERQRVAVARALANRPKLILADEPTGALDSQSSRQTLELLQQIQADGQVTLIIVTHDPDVAAAAGRVLRMHDGKIIPDSAGRA